MKMIGLKSVKRAGLELYSQAYQNALLPVESRVVTTLNFTFVGNPGTGKTTGKETLPTRSPLPTFSPSWIALELLADHVLSSRLFSSSLSGEAFGEDPAPARPADQGGVRGDGWRQASTGGQQQVHDGHSPSGELSRRAGSSV